MKNMPTCSPFLLAAPLAVASAILASPLAAQAETINIVQDINALRTLPREAGVDVSGERVHLTRSFLVQDEVGNTDQDATQPLSATTWARKIIVLPYAADADILFYGSAKKVTVNGQAATVKEGPASMWMAVSVPAAQLRAGANEIIFSDGGQLLIENSLFPDRSARSIDGGRTWLKDELGSEGIYNGEYLVRARLKGYAPSAAITSEVVDLLNPEGKSTIVPRATVQSVKLAPQSTPATGATLTFQTRTGSTPRYDAQNWSAWADTPANKDIVLAPNARYLQWRANLKTTAPGSTPALSNVRIIANVDAPALPTNIKVTSLQSRPQVSGSYTMVYQPAGSSRLKLLRDRYKLNDVIASGKTEMEQIVLLRDWVRNQWKNGWAHNNLQYVPPWDALLILDMAPREQALGMCTHYSTVFVQTALALGWNARHLVLNNHCAAEVWIDELGKWVVMDAGNSDDPTLNCHFEKDGVPLSGLEIHDLYKNNQIDKIKVVYSAGRGSIAGPELVNRKNQIQFNNYVRLAIPFRNNHLDTPFPGELEQGEAHYFHDGYLWWSDSTIPTRSSEYSRVTNRIQDMYPNLNQVALDLQAGEAANQLRAGLTTQTPNFSHYMVKVDGGEWQRHNDGAFNWTLHAGTNRLEVKSINKLGREGQASSTVVEVAA